MLIKTRWVGPFLCGWSTFRLVLKSVKIIPTTVAAGCCVKQFFISTSHGILAVILCWKIVLQCSSLNLAFLSTINGGRCFFHFIIQMKILLKFYWNFILLARKMMEIDVSLFSLRIEKTTREPPYYHFSIQPSLIGMLSITIPYTFSRQRVAPAVVVVLLRQQQQHRGVVQQPH